MYLNLCNIKEIYTLFTERTTCALSQFRSVLSDHAHRHARAPPPPPTKARAKPGYSLSERSIVSFEREYNRNL